MSENGAKQSPSMNGEKTIASDEEIWKDLEISFELDNDRFLNSTVFGTVCIKPKQARELIGKFFLCNDDSQIHIRVKFESDAEYIKASGFDPTRKHLVYIEAVPKNKNFNLLPKKSKPQVLLITRQTSSIIPVINFSWPSLTPKDFGDKRQPVVIIKWLHIDDKTAEKYVVCLDNKEVKYIRDTLRKDMFEVRIHNLESEKESYTLQIKARLNDDQDTAESDSIEFIVPDKNDEEYSEFPAPNKTDEKKIEFQFISVSKANKPKDQRPKNKNVSSKTTTPSNQQSVKNHSSSSSQSKEEPKEVKTNASCFCCRTPHDTYPGIDHYFDMNYNKQSSPPLSERKIVVPDKRMSYSDKGDPNNRNHLRKIKKEHDDDDDVVDGGSLANEIRIKTTTQ